MHFNLFPRKNSEWVDTINTIEILESETFDNMIQVESQSSSMIQVEHHHVLWYVLWRQLNSSRHSAGSRHSPRARPRTAAGCVPQRPPGHLLSLYSIYRPCIYNVYHVWKRYGTKPWSMNRVYICLTTQVVLRHAYTWYIPTYYQVDWNISCMYQI